MPTKPMALVMVMANAKKNVLECRLYRAWPCKMPLLYRTRLLLQLSPFAGDTMVAEFEELYL
ncbi:MAG: hypothetical protein KatS3mg050_2258 [Litorilinea sp.]|nr:MAG: hypothetical protein KatS3mg050_2258 [Litorilinea sp.]